MAQTYTRQSSFADGDTITAALFNNEFNQLVNAFSYSSTNAGTTGHRHDGTAGEGGNIHTIGDLDFLNKIVVDSTNNRWGFYVQVASSTVEQVRLQDGALIPVTDSDVDLGTSSLYFKDAYIDSVTTTGNVSVGGNLTVTGTTTFNGGTITMGDAATDNVVFGADVDSHIIPDDDDTYDLGSSTQQWRNIYIDGTAEVDTLTINGTAVTSTAAELNILDGVTSTATELNLLDGVTSTTAEINLLDGVTSTTAELNILDGVTATSTEINILDGVTSTTAELNILDGVTSTAAEINLLDGVTSTTAELNILDGVTSTAAELNLLDGKAFLDEDNLISNSATGIASQQSIKAYVDAQVTAQDLDFLGDSGGALSIDLDSESLTIAGGTGLDTVGTSNTITVNIDSTVATLTGTQTLTNKTLTSPVINTGVSGTAFLDDDTFGTASASTLSSSESIKAYVDTTVAANNEVVGDTTPQLGGNLDLNSNDITGTGDINITGTIQSSGNITGTLATAAQTNITSLGTLTALTGGTGDLNWDSGTLFVDSSSNAVGIGNTNPSTALDVTGTITATTLAGTLSTAAQPNITSVGTLTGLTTTGDINFGDDDKAIFGAGSDLQIYHSSSDGASYIKESGSGHLRIQGSELLLEATNGDNFFRGIEDGSVRIYHDNAEKLATTSTGIDVTGVITTDGLTTSADINFGDNDKAIFGAGSDLQIYHDGSHSYISDQGTGQLRILASQFQIMNAAGTESMVFGAQDNTATLYYDNDAKLATTSTGIDVTGTVVADGLTVDGESDLNATVTITHANPRIKLIESNSVNANTQISNDVGNFTISTMNDAESSFTSRLNIQHSTGDISFYEDTGTTAALFWDASAEALGIGTDSPRSLVNVTGSGSNGGILTLENNSNSLQTNRALGQLDFYSNDGSANGTGVKAKIQAIALNSIGNEVGLTFGTSGTGSATAVEAMRIDSSGNIGIGTDSPSAKLEVTGATLVSDDGADDFVKQSVSGTASTLSFGNTESTGGIAKWQYNRSTGSFSGFVGTAAATNFMTIDSSGNVGIGTDSPNGYRLNVVKGSAGNIAHITDGIANTFIFRSDANTLYAGNANNYPVAFVTNNTEAMRIDSSGNVGIGTDDVTDKLTINADAGDGITFDGISASAAAEQDVSDIKFINRRSSGTTVKANIKHITNGTANGSALTFGTTTGSGATERMRIDSSGNVLVGKTGLGIGTAGTEVRNNGQLLVTADGDNPVDFNRLTSDGIIANFRKDSAVVGSIGTIDGFAYISSNSNVGLKFLSSRIRPVNTDGSDRDDAIDLGATSARFDDIYATNGTIQTSDRNEKQDIEALTDAETRVAVAAKGLLRKFRWQSAVEEKGDDARIHFGIIAQDLQDAFTAEGLDAGDYAMFISSTWTDDDGVEQTRLGVRYSELLAFIIAAI